MRYRLSLMVAVVLALPSVSWAQVPGRPGIGVYGGVGGGGFGTTSSPAVSPFLNLNRLGSPAGINYYGLVRPQQDFRNSLSALQGQLAEQGVTTGNAEAGLSALITGQRARFLNTGGYFLNNNGGAGGGPSAVPIGTGLRPPMGAPVGGSNLPGGNPGGFGNSNLGGRR